MNFVFFWKQHFYRITPSWSLDLQKAQLYGLHLFCLPFYCYLYRCYFKKTDAQPNVKTKKNPPAQFAVLWILIWHPQILYHGRGCEHITYSLYKV